MKEEKAKKEEAAKAALEHKKMVEEATKREAEERAKRIAAEKAVAEEQKAIEAAAKREAGTFMISSYFWASSSTCVTDATLFSSIRIHPSPFTPYRAN